MYVYIYIYTMVTDSNLIVNRYLGCWTDSKTRTWRTQTGRGWRNTVEIVLFEISNSMKPYPSNFHAYISTLRPMIGFVDPRKTRWGFQPYSANLILCHNLPPSEIDGGLCLLFLQAQKGDTYFTELAERAEYGNCEPIVYIIIVVMIVVITYH